MEVKWVIKFLKSFKINISDMDEEYIDKIISFLQELEKYKKMWGKLENLFKCDKSDFVRDQMMFIKQKYFPQPVKKVITIEVEAEGKDDVYWLNRYAKELNMNLPSRFKVNIKEVK